MIIFDELFAPLQRTTGAGTSAIYDGEDRGHHKFQKTVWVRDDIKLPVLSGELVRRYDISTGRYGSSFSNYSAYFNFVGWRAVQMSPSMFVTFTPFSPVKLDGEATFDAKLVYAHGGNSVLAHYNIRCVGTVEDLGNSNVEHKAEYFARHIGDQIGGEELLLGSVRSRYENDQMKSSSSRWIFFQGETLRLRQVYPDWP